MSFKSNSIEINSKINNSLQLNDEWLELSQTIGKCIDEDMDLLKANINVSHLAQLMPDFRKTSKSQTISESKIRSKIDEINAKLDELDDCKSDDQNNGEEYDLNGMNAQTKRLKTLFPTLKQMVNCFAEKCEKHSNNDNNCLDHKLIEENDHKFGQTLQISHQMKDFHNSDISLNSFNKN